MLGSLLFFSAAGGDPVSEPPQEEPPTIKPIESLDPYVIMGLIADGRSDSALTLLDEDSVATNRDPLALLMKSRAMRDRLADEDVDKNLVRKDTEPIHELLDRTIELCDNAMDHSASDPIYLYYRGRAELEKAQLYVLGRSLWTASRAARRGKGDLQEFLELRPEHPDAQGDLGAFLYFADTLPSIIKFFGRLLFIPSGDREKGFEMLQYAAASDGVFASDYDMALGVIYLIFEGRIEEGAQILIELSEKYPYYARLVEPLGVAAVMHPLRVREIETVMDDALTRHLGRGGTAVDWSLVKRVQSHRTYTDMLYSSPLRAMYQFETLTENPPERPDWVLPLAIINHGYLLAKSGRHADATTAFESVLEKGSMKHFHRTARDLTQSLEQPWDAVTFDELDFVPLIYEGRTSDAMESLTEYQRQHGSDVLYHFYLGDLKVMEQRFEDAVEAYESALGLDVRGGDQLFQMLSALRIAEIKGHDHYYDEAKRMIEKSRQYIHANYVLDMLVRSRIRFYEMQDKGKLPHPPSLLIRTDAGRSESANSAR
jgi:tetratricopeptide (TPR) repeat protein